MAQLVGISGSLRQGSFNTSLLRNASQLVPPGTTLDVRTLHGIPLYNGDDESGAITDERTREQLRAFLDAFAAFATRR